MEVTVSEMKAIEKQADACGLSYTQMMENAGSGAAAVLLEQGPRPLKTAGVLCGTGNNGGDGFVLGRALAGAGVQVRFYLIGGQPKTPDADLNFHRVQALSLPVVKPPFSQVEENWLLQADVLVDALCGTGFHGSLRPEARAAARLLQKAQSFVLSLDLPSGMTADTGEADPDTVAADLTVAFHATKPCHRLAPTLCGKTVVVPIGIESLSPK